MERGDIVVAHNFVGVVCARAAMPDDVTEPHVLVKWWDYRRRKWTGAVVHWVESPSMDKVGALSELGLHLPLGGEW